MNLKIILKVCLVALIFSSCKEEILINEGGNLVLKTVDEDSNLPSIFVNGSQFHSETYGNPDSAMVVFLHGGPGADYRNGLPVKALANDGYFLVFYDQRGSGLSKRHDKNTYSVDLMIEDLREVIKYYRTSPTQKIFLIGHSWGGILAAAMIDKYPNEIDGIVFAESGGFTSESLFKYGEKTRNPPLLSEILNDVTYPDQILTGKENEHAILDYKLNLLSVTVFEEGNPEGIEGPSPQWRNGAVVLDAMRIIAEDKGYDFTKNMHKYTKKVLLLYGENNTAYGLEGALEESSFFPNASIAKIENTGHELFYFQWNAVRPIVLDYLNTQK